LAPTLALLPEYETPIRRLPGPAGGWLRSRSPA